MRVLRLVAAHDVGYQLNPMAVKGQVLGGVAQGMGWALTENLVMKDGVVQNTSFSTYMVPTIADMPEVTPIIVESHDPIGPFGAKGIGEPSLIPTPPAIANAIWDAVGVRLRELPMSPEKVFWAMREASGSANEERR